MRKWLSLALAAWMSVALAAGARADVRLGVNAPRGEAEATAQWGEFARTLGDRIGQPVRLVPLALARMREMIASGEVDYVLCNPVDAATIHEERGATYLASMVGRKGTHFGGVIIANPKAGVTKGTDLKGKRVIGLQPHAAGAYLFQAYELKQQGLDVPQAFAAYLVAKKQDDTVLAVKAGVADAGFIRTGVLEDMIAEGKIKADDVVVVDRKPGFPEALSTALYPEWYLLAVNKALGATDAKVKAAALALKADSPAAKAAEIQGFTDPVDPGPTLMMLKAMKVAPFDK